jgi:hypothetical protein
VFLYWKRIADIDRLLSIVLGSYTAMRLPLGFSVGFINYVFAEG